MNWIGCNQSSQGTPAYSCDFYNGDFYPRQISCGEETPVLNVQDGERRRKRDFSSFNGFVLSLAVSTCVLSTPIAHFVDWSFESKSCDLNRNFYNLHFSRADIVADCYVVGEPIVLEDGILTLFKPAEEIVVTKGLEFLSGYASDSFVSGVESRDLVLAVYDFLSELGGYATASHVACVLKCSVFDLEKMLDRDVRFRKSLIPGPHGEGVYILNSKLGFLKDLWATFRFYNSKKAS